MIVVSNTSPLANLAVVEGLPLLQQLYGTILIPVAVREELSPAALDSRDVGAVVPHQISEFLLRKPLSPSDFPNAPPEFLGKIVRHAAFLTGLWTGAPRTNRHSVLDRENTLW